MGIDLSSMFGSAQSTADSGMSDALQAGANSAIGFLESQVVSVVQADQAQHVAAAQTATTNLLNQPSSPFGTYFQSIMQQPVIKQYGVYILGGVAVVVVMTLILRR